MAIETMESTTYGHAIDGRERAAASGRTFEVRNPATGALVARCADGDASDVEAAVDAAARAFDDGRWSRLGVSKRFRILTAFADAIEAALDDLATLESTCTGRPIREMRAQLSRLPEWYRYFAAIARSADDIVTPFEGPYLNYIRRIPLGVVGQITPWNHPLLILSKKLAPALAAGNTVVIKPSEYTPLTTLELARIALAAGVPPGVVNVVTGFGPTAGAPLCADRRLSKIDLTGGTETGRAVARMAGERLVRASAELGGKAPVIVLDDADLDRAVGGALFAAFIASGQTCIAGARILVPEAMHDAFVDRLARRAAALRIGDPLDQRTQLGPQVSAKQLARTEEYVAIGKAEGARIACGGKRPDDPALANGYFYEPTIFTGVAPAMRIAQEEIFGPVTSVIAYRDVDDAVRIANGIEFGLGASVWTGDAARGMALAERLESGTVWINDHHRVDPAAVWGGFKQSGIGHENGHEAYREYTHIRSVIVNLDRAPDWYATTDTIRLS